MPITKMRDIAELGPPERHRSAEDGLRAAFDLVHVCYKFKPWLVERGVQRAPGPESTVAKPAQP